MDAIKLTHTLKDMLIKGITLTPIILGQPGIGKTQIVKQIAKALGFKLFLSHPATDDPVDYKGMPAKSDSGGYSFFPIGIVDAVLKCKEKAIWFMDDAPMAPTSVSSAVLQLIDPYGRQLNDQVVPDNVQIILAGNRMQDRANSHTPIEPYKSRTIPLPLDPSVEAWTLWASTIGGIDPTIIAYVNWRPENLANFKPSDDWNISPSPRGYEHLNNMLQLDLTDRESRLEWYSGALGEGVAGEYIAFSETYKNLPSRLEIEANPLTARIPHEMSEQYAMALFLSNTCTPGNLTPTIQYIKRLNSELATLWTQLMPRYTPDLVETRDFTDWVIELSPEATA